MWQCCRNAALRQMSCSRERDRTGGPLCAWHLMSLLSCCATAHSGPVDRKRKRSLPPRKCTSNNLALSKSQNIGVAVAEARQHLLVMLAKLGCHPNAGRSFRNRPGGTMNPEALAVLGIVDLGDVAVGAYVRVDGCFEQGVDRRRDNVGSPELGHPMVARVGREEPVQQREQFASLLC